MLFVGLDRFRLVNEALGHDAGDALLAEVARRLQRCAGVSDVVARTGGDEFAVLAGGAGRRDDAAALARRLQAALEPMAVVHAHECRVTASVGIGMFPDDALDGAGLMGAADVAMHQAKEDGGNALRFHRREARPVPGRRLRLQTGLRDALERDELSLHYQAKVDLASGRICGVEALLRWDSAAFGPVAPTEFIPIAEENGLILPITLGVMLVAAYNKKIVGEYKHPVWMAVFGAIVVVMTAYMGYVTLTTQLSKLFA